MHPIVDKASRALMYLQSSGGGDGSLPNYYILNDAPEWVKDLCCNAYEDSLPNNHIYHMIYKDMLDLCRIAMNVTKRYRLKPLKISLRELNRPPPSTFFGWDAAVGRQPLRRLGLPKKPQGFSPSGASHHDRD